MLRASTLRLSRAACSRSFVTAKLPDLPYDAGSLAPVISGEIMTVHHSKHHAAYVANYNAAAEQTAEAEAKGDVARVIALQSAVKFNGGGHVNHSLFWKNLVPPKDFAPPEGALLAHIQKDHGSLEALIKKFSAAAVGVQGSGWGWLGYSKADDRLVVATTANQDPLSTLGLVPVLGIDVWEHAYYLQYKNLRPAYMTEVWKVVNWKNVGENLAAAKA